MELEDLNLPIKIVTAVTEGLANLGIEPPLFIAQAFMLVLCIAAFIFGIILLRRRGIKNLMGLLVTIGFGLFAIGIIYFWLDNIMRPLPGRVTGNVEIVNRDDPGLYYDMRLTLLDFRDRNITIEGGFVDGRDGSFVLAYRPIFGDYPRSIQVTTPESKAQMFSLNRARLQTGTGIKLQYHHGGEE